MEVSVVVGGCGRGIFICLQESVKSKGEGRPEESSVMRQHIYCACGIVDGA